MPIRTTRVGTTSANTIPSNYTSNNKQPLLRQYNDNATPKYIGGINNIVDLNKIFTPPFNSIFG